MTKKKESKPIERKMDSVYAPDLNAIVDRIFERAWKQKVSWPELVLKSGVSSNTISRLANRLTRYPQYRTVVLLAHALGARLEVVNGPKYSKATIHWTTLRFKDFAKKLKIKKPKTAKVA